MKRKIACKDCMYYGQQSGKCSRSGNDKLEYSTCEAATQRLFVLRLDNGCYWTGYNNYDVQLRKARIYTSPKMADEAGKYILERLKHIKSFEIVEVELRIKNEHI